jgi:serine/threonine protein kinase
MGDATHSSQLFAPGASANYDRSFGMQIATGDVIAARYRADALLGRGGMGEVWRCFDLAERRDVAIKTVLAEHIENPHVWRLFQSEVIAVARLSHPGIVEVYDLLPAGDGGMLLVMEYRPGKALDQVRRSIPSWSLVRTLLVQLLEALAHAHARSVLHLDIKPGNVLVEKTGEDVRVTLVDFGIARVKRGGRGAERWFDDAVVVGTPEYMAPEQCMGEIEKLGPWTDLYALAMMIYELCAGELPDPFDDPVSAIRRRLTEPVPPMVPQLRGVPDGFGSVCHWMLAIDPLDRPTGAAEVLDEIERIDPRDARRSDLRGLSSRPPVASDTPPDSSAATLAIAPTLARDRLQDLFDDLDEEAQAQPTSTHGLSAPPSSRRLAGEAEHAFTAEATAPTPGAYGLFGLRELPVLGRVDERRALWGAVRATAVDLAPAAVLLRGPAGTGKSRLARDATERAVELGLTTVVHTHWSAAGSADEGLRGLLENALESRGHVEMEFEARLSFWMRRWMGEDEFFAHELRVLLRPARDAAPDAGLALRLAVEAIARVAQVRPVLLWLDDVQWSRGEAAALVEGIAALAPRPAVCVLATVRQEEEDDPAHEALVTALGRLCRGSALVEVPMTPLGPLAARALVRGLLHLEPDVREVVALRAEGNPLFATQLVRQLVVERAVVRRGKRYGLAPGVDVRAILPADIGAVWARRVELSGVDERDLRALAVVRERVSVEVADALGGCAGPTFPRSIASALAAGLLVVEGGRYLWAHGLLREYLLGRIGDDAPLLHTWAAKALSSLMNHEDVQEERALHLAAAGRPREACEAMLDASLWCWRRAERPARGRRIAWLKAHAAAEGFFDLELRALAELAHLHAECGDHDEADGVLSAAKDSLELVDDRTAAWLFLRISQAALLSGRRQDGLDASTRAVKIASRAGEREVEALGRLQIALDAYRRGQADIARDLLDHVLEVARAAGNRAIEAQACIPRSALEPPAAQEPLLRAAIEMAHSAGALRVELMAKQVWTDSLWKVGLRGQARAVAAQVSREASRRSMRQTVSIVELQAACWAVDEDDWEAVRTHRATAAEWGAATGAVPERAFISALDVLLSLVEGRDAELVIEQLEDCAQGYDEPTFRDLVTKATTLAPPRHAARLRALVAA